MREDTDGRTDRRTDGQTDATKYIISLASRSITNEKILKKHPKLKDAKFVRIHRNKQFKPNQKKPRDTIVCFWDFNERCAVLSGKMEMSKGIFVNQDFPPAVVFAKRTLKPILQIVKGTPYGERKRTKLIAGVLYVDGKRYTLQNLVTLPEAIKFYHFMDLHDIKNTTEILSNF